jgi:hypothetical protein
MTSLIFPFSLSVGLVRYFDSLFGANLFSMSLDVEDGSETDDDNSADEDSDNDEDSGEDDSDR